MRILTIASDIGVTAPGIVYESFISSLLERHTVSLISSCLSEKICISKIHKFIRILNEPLVHYKLEKIFFKSIGRNILVDSYVYYIFFKNDYSFVKNIDLIITFASCNHYISTQLGYILSKKYNKKWLVYSVDAIPAPVEWIKGDLQYYYHWKKYISFYFSQADAFLSANPKMLEYEISLFNNNAQITGVLYTPIKKIYTIKKGQHQQVVNLLYTGSIYGPRKKEALLDGFRLFLKRQPDATLTFVGLFRPDNFHGYEDLIESRNIVLVEFTNDLQPYYDNATILIDINTYFENDVFLSSKIINYLPIERPIISITGANSPSRNLFIDDSSIIHCEHNSKEVYEAINKALASEFDYSNRKKYIDMMSIDSQIRTLYDIIKKLNL